MEFKITLKAARIMSDYNLNEAAKKFGVHWQSLSSWEKNSNKMKQKYVQMIPEIYHVPIDNIFFGDEDEFILLNENNKLNKIK